MRFPHITGVELPRSGSGARQRTFSLVLQRSGKAVSVETPVPCGPRHAGQFPAQDKGAKSVRAAIQKRWRRNIILIFICVVRHLTDYWRQNASKTPAQCGLDLNELCTAVWRHV